MRNELSELIKQVKEINSENRCSWLLENFPITAKNYYYAIYVIPHFSWKKKDRLVLMEYYLKKIPFASEKPYKIFMQIAPIQEFVKVICELTKNTSDEDMKLLKYHLTSLIKENLRNNNTRINETFVADLSSLGVYIGQ